jgi:phage terminase large subunit-like protein
VGAVHAHRADRVVVEVNQGGALVPGVLRTVDPNVPLATVHAARAKEARAEPVAALYEQGRVHHVGLFPDLEEQLCSWVPGEGESPDRLDALVWALTALIIAPRGGLAARLAAMTPTEREAYFQRQRAVLAASPLFRV